MTLKGVNLVLTSSSFPTGKLDDSAGVFATSVKRGAAGQVRLTGDAYMSD